jgi:hypothetical protein
MKLKLLMTSQTSLQQKSEATGKPDVKAVSRLRLPPASADWLPVLTFGLKMEVIGSSETSALSLKRTMSQLRRFQPSQFRENRDTSTLPSSEG